jgi:hypothetical protein
VAAERKITENSMATASHTPAKAMATSRKATPRATSTPLGGTPMVSSAAPTISSHSATRAVDRVHRPARNLPSSSASR